MRRAPVPQRPVRVRKARPGRPYRPGLETLEPRALLATIAFDMVGSASQNLLAFTNPSDNAFSSPADGFQKYQRGASPSIPFAVLDDSLLTFPADMQGIVDDNNLDVFFGATDTENPDHSGPVTATWQFDISSGGGSPLTLSVDMGAMGDFESGGATPDTFTWTYQIDGGPEQTAFTGVVDESASATYTLASGTSVTRDDPLTVSGTALTNILTKFTAPLVGTGHVLTLKLTAQTDGGDEAFAFQNLIVDAAAPFSAFDMVGSASQNLLAFTNPSDNAFSSPADGFQKYQRGVSPSIPFAVLDDSLLTFPGDMQGIVDDNNLDVFFAATDTENPDHSGPVTATWQFDISGGGGSPLLLSIDMGAMGDFESGGATPDTFAWTYQIDGGPAQTAFTGVVDESASVTYTLASGTSVTRDDPLTVSGTVLTNILTTFTAPLVGTGHVLTLTLTAQTDGGDEAFAFQNILIQPGSPPPPPAAEPIYQIQGAAAASPLAGQIVTTSGVVIGDFQGSQRLDGFFVQDPAGDADPFTSDGIFVHAPGAVDVAVGDIVVLTGTVAEVSGETRLQDLTDLRIVAMNGAVAPTTASLPLAQADDLERFEGMLVRFQQPLTVTENFDLGRFGEVVLSSGGRLYNPTQVAPPGAVANAVAAANDLNRIVLDDGSSGQNPDPVIHPAPELTAANSLRGGDTVTGLTGTIGYRFGSYRVQPVTPPGVIFAHANPRPAAPAAVGGALTVASFNVLNYFTTLNQPGNTCGPLGEACRGADSSSELARQRDKLVSALVTMDADIVGLVELENNYGAATSAIEDLVQALNAVAGAGTYDSIDPGVPFLGGQPITVGLIYQPNRVTPAGDPAFLQTGAFEYTSGGFTSNRNRVPLAQTFMENASGEILTVAVNHFKSKGESGASNPADPNFDQGDEQGFWNALRTQAAHELAAWLASDPTGSGDPDVLILGDLNAYALEDPLTALQAAGYTDLGRLFEGLAGQSSFVFFGEAGSLDYGLANSSLVTQVTGATTWRINSDEPRVLDYNLEFHTPAQQAKFYAADPYRSSDHDPLIVGLALGAEAPEPPRHDSVRIATYNASLNRNAAGELIGDLSGDDPQARQIAEILQRVRPDVVLLNEFDFDDQGTGGGSRAAELFQGNYLSVGQNGAEPIVYPYMFSAPSNTGLLSGFDLDNNGVVAQPGDLGTGNYGNDSLGFGLFPGQFGMVLLSRFPILNHEARSFRNFLWKDMPGALLPDDPATPLPSDWYSPAELDAVRLSSKSHWDVPLNVHGQTIHVLASHPTPPVFDGPEDRNGRRNHDEIRFWADYVTPGAGGYIYDDQGARGGIAAGDAFVILGDQNADPLDGDSTNQAILQLLDNPFINTRITPASTGGPDAASRQGQANNLHLADPAFDTADFNDASPGNLRADYALPSRDLTIVNAGVFWPRDEDPLFRLVGDFDFRLIGQGFPTGFFSSDHRLVYVDVASDVSRLRVRDVEFLGEATFPTGFAWGGTEIGGLSGITYDHAQQRYFAISDDPSQFQDARFYQLAIDLADGALDDGDVVFQAVTSLLTAAGAPYAPLEIDAEGIALSRDGTLFIVSERNLAGAPFVNEFSLAGQLLRELPVPAKFLPGPGIGVRTNLAFESATITPDQRYLYTATENALAQDGPAADLGTESTARILKYDLATGQPVAEFAYVTEEVPEAPVPSGAFRTNGLVELLAIDNNGSLLALERAFSVGVGNSVKLYEVLTQPAVDVSGFPALDGLEPDPPVLKRELFDFADLGIPLDNLEGITFGPLLPDGRQSLIVVSDNNFSATDQFTQFLALALDIERLPAVLPTVETPRVLDGFDPLPPGEKAGDADDPAIYVHPHDPSLSMVLGTLKNGGLQVYDLAGQVLQSIAPAGIRYNNVDLVYGFPLRVAGGGTELADLAVVSDRENDTLAVFRINPATRQLTDVTSPSIPASLFGMDDGEATAYGLANYVSPLDGTAYAFVTQADGNQVVQLRLHSDLPGRVTASEVRRISLPVPTGNPEDSVSEGLVVDQELGFLYLSMENADSGSPDDPGILKFEAEPDRGNDFTLVAALHAPYLTADIEGLALYYGPDGTGYLIASSQGDGSFAVFAREGDNQYLGSFVVGAAGGIDSNEESDGLDVVNVALGDAFPQGLLVVHDGNQQPQAPVLDEDEIENGAKNFKFVPWEHVAHGWTPFLAIDTVSFDPRHPATPQTLNIASGDTTQHSTVLWAHAGRTGQLVFEVATDAAFHNLVETRTVPVPGPTLLPVKVAIGGLSPGTEYFYRVSDTFQQRQTGRFRTSTASDAYAGLAFGVSGDWRGELAPYPAVSNAAAAELDFFVALGDTIYADYPSPDVPLPQARTLDEFRRKQNEVYSSRLGANTLGDVRASTSILATIDDHEVTNDFAGGADPDSDPRFAGQPGQFINETPLYAAGLQAFQEFNPLADRFYPATGDDRTAGKPQLYRANQHGLDAATFVLDARSFRDPQLPPVANPNDPLQVGQFLAAAFNPQRTMLGRRQVDDLKADLLAADQAGVTWKFILVPEPIQNLGVVGAGDRFEGYAAERTEILRFITERQIDNVVFVAADVHGTVVNNLTYQQAPSGSQIPTTAFEITTGSVAFDAPFGPTVADLAAGLGLLGTADKLLYDALPPAGQDQFLKQLINSSIGPLGYDPVGLNQNLAAADGLIDAQLTAGDYVALHTYGWTQFEIAAETQQLTVTTWGIPPYSVADLALDPSSVLNREPVIVSQFTVNPRQDFSQTARLVGSTLVVTGSELDDRINVSRRLASGELEVRRGRELLGSFSTDRVERIRIEGLGGNDRLEVDLNVRQDAVLIGGAGDDLLRGSFGNDLLIGGDGRDWLVGLHGRDVLVGGTGEDRIHGGAGDDLLVGGATDDDNDLAAWDDIWRTWNSAAPYAARVADLLTGNGVPALNPATVTDDGVRDYLYGQQDQDLFYEGLRDWLPDDARDERVVRI